MLLFGDFWAESSPDVQSSVSELSHLPESIFSFWKERSSKNLNWLEENFVDLNRTDMPGIKHLEVLSPVIERLCKSEAHCAREVRRQARTFASKLPVFVHEEWQNNISAQHTRVGGGFATKTHRNDYWFCQQNKNIQRKNPIVFPNLLSSWQFGGTRLLRTRGTIHLRLNPEHDMTRRTRLQNTRSLEGCSW